MGKRDRSRGRLAATRQFLTLLGDPQLTTPSVHVTGTSGKGSTAAMIAAVLAAAGYRVGLRTSPYLQVATEKLQVGSILIDAGAFDDLSARVIAEHDRLLAIGRIESPLGYAEIWSAMTFLWFAEQAVDIAVVEVGAGGRFDATNVISPVVSVITNVGLDHLAHLGPSIAEIAWHKAGIIKPGTTAVVGNVPPTAWSVISAEAKLSSASLIRPAAEPSETRSWPQLPGAFQGANAAVAMAAIGALHDRGFPVLAEAGTNGLAAARLPCRLERMPQTERPVVWLDGAHNADKIAALVREAPLLSDNGPFPVVVVGMLSTKDTRFIVKGLTPFASAIVATEPRVLGKRSLPVRELAHAIQASGYSGSVRVQPDPMCALQEAESIARVSGANVLVTGSMYLAGHVRGRWYPNAEVVLQRTSWPRRNSRSRYAFPDRSVAL